MLPRGLYFSPLYSLCNVRIFRQIPSFVNLERSRQAAFEIAGIDEMMAGRFHFAGSDRLGDVGIFGQIPGLVDRYAAQQQPHDVQEFVVGIINLQLAIDRDNGKPLL